MWSNVYRQTGKNGGAENKRPGCNPRKRQCPIVLAHATERRHA